MYKTVRTATIALGLVLAAAAGCKKDKKTDDTTAGSAAASGSATGSSMAGSSMAGSSMAGSSMAGSSMAGSGSAAAPSGDRPASITPELVAANDKVTAVAKETVESLKTASGDCKKMAAALDAATAKLKPETDKLGALLDKLDEAGTTYYADHMIADMSAAFGAMDPILATCKDSADVVTAAQNYSKTLIGE